MAKVWSDYTVEELLSMTSEELVAVPYEMQGPWKDDVDDYTPISPDRLNRMEAGIKRANDAWDSKSQQRFVPFASSIAARGYVVVKLPAVNGYRVCACTMEANEIGNTAPYLTSPNVFIDGSGSVRIINANDYSGSISGTVVCRYLKV